MEQYIAPAIAFASIALIGWLYYRSRVRKRTGGRYTPERNDKQQER